MKILLLKEIKTNIHGTVTLADRLFKYFNNNGHDCYLSKYCESPIIDSYGLKDKILPLNQWKLKEHEVFYKKVNFDIIYCLTSYDALIAHRLKDLYFKTAKVFIGIYHPRQFMIPTHFINNYQEYLYTKLIKNTHPANLIFMDEACKRSHTEYYKLNFEDSPVIPLPMTILGKELSNYYDQNKIVSVGRITDFKPYPFGVVKALKKLKNNQKTTFKYHVIGEGCNHEKLKKLISDLDMEEDVILHGSIPYLKINDLIKDAYYFIGMGTTVGEAAGIGIPSIVAIDDEENDCYGLVGRLPDNILGEQGEELPTISYEELLYKLSNLTADAYKKERQLSLEKSNYYAVEKVAKSFIKVFEKGSNDHLKVSILDLFLFQAARVQLKFFLKKRFRQK
jgi:hypothetical protein